MLRRTPFMGIRSCSLAAKNTVLIKTASPALLSNHRLNHNNNNNNNNHFITSSQLFQQTARNLSVKAQQRQQREQNNEETSSSSSSATEGEWIQDAEFVEHETQQAGVKKRRITASQLPKHTTKEMASYPSATFEQKGLRQGYRKVNDVAQLIRGLNAKEALFQLEFCGRKVGVPLAKFLRGCMINCENFHSMNADRLLVKEAYVGRGKYLARIRYHAKMRHGIMRRKSTNFYIKLVEVPLKENERRLGRWGWTNETWNKIYSEYERRKSEEEATNTTTETTATEGTEQQQQQA